MTGYKGYRGYVAVAVAALFAVVSPARAQETPATPGPMVVERIQDGWLFAPEMRAADLAVETGALAGGYIGRIFDDTLVVGGGAYVLANQDDDFSMWYAGPVIEWLVRTDRRIGFGMRGLVGGGSATLPLPLSDVLDPHILALNDRVTRNRRGVDLQLWDPTARVGVRDDFFIVEPQLNMLVNFTRGQRLVFGLGYRAVGAAPTLGDQLNGISGSVSYQIRAGK